MALTVECYAGHRGEETPRRFRMGRRQVEIVEVLDRWLEPELSYFKVAADDGATYILRHDVRLGAWDLTMFDSGRVATGLGTRD
ncbi:MAG: hypothetical protein R3286_10365 [Gammaproteobacteria bacterium]|nr:hypothetical protein [Gammaproteobacteria bacterium]